MRALILCVLLAGPLGAELVQYRATAPTVVDQWFPGATLVDGEHTLTVILAAQVPDTMVVDYTVDTVANLWRVDLISFPVHPFIAGERDLEWVPTNEVVGMESWTTVAGVPLFQVDGIAFLGDSVQLSGVPEPINPGSPWVFDEDGRGNREPIEEWSPENEYIYPVQWRLRPADRGFYGVQNTTFGPSEVMPSLVVPEPSTFWLVGLLGVLMVGRKLWKE